MEESKLIVLLFSKTVVTCSFEDTQIWWKMSVPYILTRALKNEKNSYIFLLESNESVFFSQTPEQLLKVENQVLSTKAVAGTIKRSQNDKKMKQTYKLF